MTEERRRGHSRIAIGVDVGGSGIKAAVVDVEAGRFRSERLRVADAQPVHARRRRSPRSPRHQAARQVERARRPSTPVGIGLPGRDHRRRAQDGRATSIPAWVDFPVVERLSRALGRPVTIVNDADAAGIAEMRFGSGKASRASSSSSRSGPASDRGSSSTARSSRTRSSARWRSAGARPSGDPRPRPGPPRAVVEGVGDRISMSTSTRIDELHVAEPHHPGRRRQQERRPVHPATDRPRSRSSPPSCATTRASSARRSWPPNGRGAAQPEDHPVD